MSRQARLETCQPGLQAGDGELEVLLCFGKSCLVYQFNLLMWVVCPSWHWPCSRLAWRSCQRDYT
jgi:hypothetical protein